MVQHCACEGHGREIVELLRPEESAYFVLKPKHSGFFSTTLETLLGYLGAETLIITGIAGNFCVLFTANDAYMRDYNLFTPCDCTVSNAKKENDGALALMKKFLKADKRLRLGSDCNGHQTNSFEGKKILTILSAAGFLLQLVDLF